MDYLTLFHSSASLLPKIALLFATAIGVSVVVWLIFKLYNFFRLLKQEVVYLELTPPARVDQSPEATSRLFSALHGLGSSRKFLDKLLHHDDAFSVEITNTRKEGIRFITRVAKDKADILEHSIAAYMPDVKAKRIKDYLPRATKNKAKVFEFKQTEHFAYPLQNHEILEHHDPIGYLTSAMTQLAPDELVSFQVVLTPVRVRQAEALSHKILNNEDLLPKLSGGRSYLPVITNVINKILFGIIDAIGNTYHGSSKGTYYSGQKELEYQKQVAKRIRPVRTLSYFEHELIESIHGKLAQLLFKAEIRVLLDCDTKQEFKQRKKSIESALNLFTVPKYQSLKAARMRYGWWQRYQQFAFRNRLPSLFRSPSILGAAEVASLHHFPNSHSAKTENIVKSLSKTLPAPLSLKNGSKLDVLLGENLHHGDTTPIGLTASERERHAYIIGGTGNGKTTMMQYAIVQDIVAGKGVAVIDPHGDLAETLLKHIPEERKDDVIYFRPYDIEYPVGLNLLELPDGLTKTEMHLEKDFITEAVVSIFRKTFSDDDSGGHRIEYILRNTIRTAFTVKDATLFTLYDLLTDAAFRKAVTDKLEDKRLKNFWKEEFGKAGAMQRVKIGHGVTTKLGRFDGSEQVKRVMEQPVSTINFDDIINTGKILICNFAKGELGEDTSELFGISVLAKLQLAAHRRALQSENERRPFYLYVDEFQNFATMSFVQLLSEARKYKMFLTMAEQSTAQQDQQQLVEIILANVGTVVCFRSGSPADERFILPLFKQHLDEGEIANLPSFNFYMRIAAVEAHEPLSGQTVLLESLGSKEVADEVRQQSREQYATEYQDEDEPEITKAVESSTKDKAQRQDKKQLTKGMRKPATRVSQAKA